MRRKRNVPVYPSWPLLAALRHRRPPLDLAGRVEGGHEQQGLGREGV
jgi:hypothetical protein